MVITIGLIYVLTHSMGPWFCVKSLNGSCVCYAVHKLSEMDGKPCHNHDTCLFAKSLVNTLHFTCCVNRPPPFYFSLSHFSEGGSHLVCTMSLEGGPWVQTTSASNMSAYPAI